MLRFRKQAFLCLSLVLTGCSDNNTNAGDASQAPPTTLPPFTQYRSDFIRANEGQPLGVAPCIYPVDFGIVGQAEACTIPITGYSQTNWIPGPAYGSWRVMVNYEPAWRSPLGGPPNQSRPLDGNPFGLTVTDTSATLAIGPNSDGKIPYLGLNYIRGVQNDPILYLSKSGNFGTLTLNGRVSVEPGTTAWAFLWLLFRDSNNQMVMLERDLYNSRPSGQTYWNWPATASSYYPGALLVHNEIYVSEAGTFDIRKLVMADYPAALGMDFLGFEVAIEKSPGPGSISYTLWDARYH